MQQHQYQQQQQPLNEGVTVLRYTHFTCLIIHCCNITRHSVTIIATVYIFT